MCKFQARFFNTQLCIKAIRKQKTVFPNLVTDGLSETIKPAKLRHF
jgi:hypothetical protein